MRCAILRDAVSGALCGYVEIHHPGLCCDFVEINREYCFDVHGDITYSGLLFSSEGKTGWWIGFDCHHAPDLAPATVAFWSSVVGGSRRSVFELLVDHLNKAGMYQPVYRDLEYVRGQVERLAAQVAEYERTHETRRRA